MKVFIISNKTTLVRHWGRWYRVQRGAEDWRRMDFKPYQKPKTIGDIAKSLKKQYPKTKAKGKQ